MKRTNKLQPVPARCTGMVFSGGVPSSPAFSCRMGGVLRGDFAREGTWKSLREGPHGAFCHADENPNELSERTGLTLEARGQQGRQRPHSVSSPVVTKI